jgi:hypothetical protein
MDANDEDVGAIRERSVPVFFPDRFLALGGPELRGTIRGLALVAIFASGVRMWVVDLGFMVGSANYRLCDAYGVGSRFAVIVDYLARTFGKTTPDPLVHG